MFKKSGLPCSFALYKRDSHISIALLLSFAFQSIFCQTSEATKSLYPSKNNPAVIEMVFGRKKGSTPSVQDDVAQDPPAQKGSPKSDEHDEDAAPNGFVRVMRKVYRPLGFHKGYNFPLCRSSMSLAPERYIPNC